MKKILLFSVIFTMIFLGNAAPVDSTRAKSVGANFLNAIGQADAAPANMRSVHLNDATRSEAPFHIFNTDHGFVIVAGDDAVQPILAYSTERPFRTADMPAHLRAWFDDWTQAFRQVRELRPAAEPAVAQQWQSLATAQGARAAFSRSRSVAPLLSTTWNQDDYYNNLCPADAQGPNGHVYAGCVAAAMAQVLNYHQWPTTGYGTHSYYCDQYTDYGTQTANFGQTTYNYGLMPSELTAQSSAAQVNEVAKLMYHCGVALNMEYNYDGSGTYSTMVRAAATNHFKYNVQMATKYYSTGTYSTHTLYDDEEWAAMIKGYLDENLPVIYSGADRYAGGHTFVCDGYDYMYDVDNDRYSDYFHINWGWGGWNDGYYELTWLRPGDYSFNYGSPDILVLTPDRRENAPDTLLFNSRGTTTITLQGETSIAHPMGFNTLSNPHYSNSAVDTLILYPRPGDERILLERVSHDRHTVTVYDGVGTEGTQLAVIDNGWDESARTVLSTAGALTLVFNGNWYTDGLELRATSASCVPIITSLGVSNESTTATVSWQVYEAGNYTNHNFGYALEYGPQGFTPGTGTTLHPTGTSCLIGGLRPTTAYDVYLTYNCLTNGRNTVGPVTFTTQPLPYDCMPPQDFTVNSTARGDSLFLQWIPGFEETSWTVEYGEAGFTLGTGTSHTVSTPADTIIALCGGVYDFYVKSNCEGSDSHWVSVLNYTVGRNYITIGEGTTTNIIFPIGYYSNRYYTYTQQLYTAADFAGAHFESHNITSLAFEYRGTSQTKENIQVYLANSTLTELNDWVSPGQLTLVYDGSVALEEGWVTIEFDRPFAWSGNSLVVAMHNNSGTDNGSAYSLTHRTANFTAIERTDTRPVDMANPTDLTRYRQRNNMRFGFQTRSSFECPTPENFAIANADTYTPTLTWDGSSAAQEWRLEYGEAGFERGTGTSVTLTEPTFSTRLLAGTYDFYLSTYCGEDLCGSITTPAVALQNVEVGSECHTMAYGESSTNNFFPIGAEASYLNKTYTQQIYTASELQQSGLLPDQLITKLSFYCNRNINVEKDDVTVFLGNTPYSEFPDSWIPVTDLQQVFHGSVALHEGRITITFQEPFLWDGSSIVVAMLNNSSTEECYYDFVINNMPQPMSAKHSWDQDIDPYSQEVQEMALYRSEIRNVMDFCQDTLCVSRRDYSTWIADGDTYDFYGRTLTEPGTYTHRFIANEECDSLVTLHLEVRKVIFVTTTGAGSRDGSTWANAMTLQQALDTAQSFTDRKPYIFVKKGTYTGNTSGTNSFEIKPNAFVYGGFVGTEDAHFDLDSRDIAGNPTILFGSNSRRVLYQAADFSESQATLFDGFTIRGGTVNGGINEGGAAYIRANCTLANCTITNNNAAISGSDNNINFKGVAVYSSRGTLRNCNIHTNRVDLSGSGSNHRIYGVGVYNDRSTIEDCIINNNTAVYDGTGDSWYTYGGGVYVSSNAGDGVITGCTLTRNTASHGGGIYAERTCQLTNCIISNNTARSEGGGAWFGGGRNNYPGITAVQTHFGNNAAGSQGGGIYVMRARNTFTNCNIVRNSATSDGGGIYFFYRDIDTTFKICNSIVWGNKVNANHNQFGGNSGYQLLASAVQDNLTGAVALQAENSGTGLGFPMFANPTAEAGVDATNSIGDWHLLAGSACIDMGRTDLAASETDIEGNPRVQYDRVDVGIYESAHPMAQPIRPENESNIIYVTTTGAGLQDGSSWANATPLLQHAMNVAAVNEQHAAVWMAAGTYTPEQTLIVQPYAAVYGGFAGNEPNIFDLSQRNFEANATILDGSTAHRILEQTETFTEFIPSQSEWHFLTRITLFDGLTMQNGSRGSSDYALNYHCHLYHCNVVNNLGHGIKTEGGTIRDCIFRGNGGNGIEGSGANIQRTLVEQNSLKGIKTSNGCLITDCTVRNNQSDGIYLYNSSLYNSVVDGNGGYGLLCEGSNTQVFNTKVTNNQSSGIRTYGGLFVNALIANNLFSGVVAYDHARFVNCDIVNNHYNTTGTYYAAGIRNESNDNEFTNCIVWNNRNNNGPLNITGTSTFSYCAVEGGYEGTANIALAHSNSGSAAGSNYVRFVNPTLTTGPTTETGYDWNLAAGSACINMGNPNTTSLNLPETDLGGSLRIKQNRLDIGAYEFGDVVYQQVDDEICLGESFFYGDYFLYPESAGFFTDTFVYYENETDYVAYIALTVHDVYNHQVEEVICEGETFAFNGQNYDTEGYYTANLQSAFGCDSTVVLHLTVLPKSYNAFTQEACDSYTWNDVTYTESGDYTQIFEAANGCDSIVTLSLTIHRSTETEFGQVACYHFTWNGVTYDESGDYVQTLQTSHGCDSTVTMHLTILDAITTEWSHECCYNYTWNGQTFSVSGDYVQTFTSSIGCDSIVTLHLTIHPAVETSFRATACDSYTWNGQTYTASGDYTQQFTNIYGCDSTVTLHLTIHRSRESEFSAVACESYSWNGQTYTASGNYVQTLATIHGCDSVVTLHLTVNHIVTTELTDGSCSLYEWNGQTYTESGDYVQTFTAANGCDSVVTLHLTVVPEFVPEIIVTGSITACESSSATLSVSGSYEDYTWSTGATTPTLTATTAGYYWVTVADEFGCAGTSEMVQLGVSELITEAPAICMVGVQGQHNMVVWEPMDNPYVQSFRIYRENGQANIYEPIGTVPAYLGQNFFVDNSSNPAVRAYRYKIAAMDACLSETELSDFHKTLHLTINQGIGSSWNLIWTPYEGFDFASYRIYRGTTNENLQLIATMPATLTSYTDFENVDGALFYQIEVVKEGGCLQTRDENLAGARSNIVYNRVPVYAETTLEACDSYDWNGELLTASDDYTQSFTSTLGYDSVATLHLTVYQSVENEISANACDAYTWDGESYTASGDYTRTFATTHGCDSVVTLHLTITETPEVAISGNLDIRQGESTTLTATYNSAWNYYWSTGETGNAITVSPDVTTTYSVTATHVNCSATAAATVNVTVGIAEMSRAGIRIYPNPATQILNVEAAGYSEVAIVNVLGKEVYRSGISGKAQIDVSGLSDGVYFIRLCNAEGVVNQKFVKK